MADENTTPESGKRLMPSNSTTVGTLAGGSLATIIVWLLEALGHLTVPSTVASAIGAVVGNGVGYFFEGGRKS